MTAKDSDNKKGLYLGVGAAVLILVAAIIFSASDDDAVVAPTVAEQPKMKANEEKPVEVELVLEFDLVRIARGGTGVIAGRTLAGADVHLLANGTALTTIKADERGEWVIILNDPLEPGTMELSLKATLTDGREIEAEKVVVISVPPREEKRFLARKESGVVAVLAPKDGKGPSEVMQKPGIAAFAEVGDSLAVDTVDYGDGSATIKGRSLPRVDVRIYLDEVYIGTAKADDRGTWQVTVGGLDLAPGQHILRVDQTVGKGDVQLRIEQPFELGVPLDPSKAQNGVIVKPGNTLWHIARRLYGSGVRYTMIFKENSEVIRDPNLIYPGQMFKLPAKVAKDEDK